MPTPIGHALGGIAVGYVVAACRGHSSSRSSQFGIPWTGLGCSVLSLSVIAVLPDIDLLFGVHRGLTHSVTAALIIGVVYGCFQPTDRFGVGTCAFLAYGSHLAFDWCGVDTGPPSGLMAFWPLSENYYQSSILIFHRVCREYWDPACWENNVMALGWELVVLLPVTAIAIVLHKRFVS